MTTRRGRVPIPAHARRSRQHGAHHLALHTDSPAVNDAQNAEPEPVRFDQVLFHNGFDITRGHAVKVEDVADRNAEWFAVFRFQWTSEKAKGPAPPKGPGQDGLPFNRAHPMLSDLGRPVVAHDRFHLIFQTEFQFLQPRLLQLLLLGQVGKRFQFVQLVGELRVLAGKEAKLLICSHQTRFQLFNCNPFHILQFLPAEVATPSRSVPQGSVGNLTLFYRRHHRLRPP